MTATGDVDSNGSAIVRKWRQSKNTFGEKTAQMVRMVQKMDEDLGLQKFLWVCSVLGGLLLFLYT